MKHKSVKWMLENIDQIREEDIAQYAVIEFINWYNETNK